MRAYRCLVTTTLVRVFIGHTHYGVLVRVERMMLTTIMQYDDCIMRNTIVVCREYLICIDIDKKSRRHIVSSFLCLTQCTILSSPFLLRSFLLHSHNTHNNVYECMILFMPLPDTVTIYKYMCMYAYILSYISLRGAQHLTDVRACATTFL